MVRPGCMLQAGTTNRSSDLQIAIVGSFISLAIFFTPRPSHLSHQLKLWVSPSQLHIRNTSTYSETNYVRLLGWSGKCKHGCMHYSFLGESPIKKTTGFFFKQRLVKVIIQMLFRLLGTLYVPKRDTSVTSAQVRSAVLNHIFTPETGCSII